MPGINPGPNVQVTPNTQAGMVTPGQSTSLTTYSTNPGGVAVNLLDENGNSIAPFIGKSVPLVQKWTRMANVNDFLNQNGRPGGIWTQPNISGVTQDNNIYRREGASLQFLSANFLSNYAQCQANNTVNWNFSAGGVVAVLVYIAKINASTKVILTLGTSSTNYKQVQWTQPAGNLRFGWNVLSIHTSEDGTTFVPYYNANNPDVGGVTQSGGLSGPWAWTTTGTGINFATQNVTFARVEFDDSINGAGAPGQFYLEGIYFGGMGQPIVTLGLDGCLPQLVNYAIPIATQWGIKCTVHPIGTASGLAPDFSLASSAATAIANGFDVVTHTMNHTSASTYSDQNKIINEMATMRDMAQVAYANPPSSIDGSIAPNLIVTEQSAWAMPQAGVAYQRGGSATGCHTYMSESLVGIDFPQAIPSQALQGTMTGADIINLINGTIKYGSTLVWYTHGVVGPADKVNGGGSFTWTIGTTNGSNIITMNTNQYTIPVGASITSANFVSSTIVKVIPGTGYQISNNATTTGSVTATIGASGGPCFYGLGDLSSVFVNDSVFTGSLYAYTWNRVCQYLAQTYIPAGGQVLTYYQWKQRAWFPQPNVSFPPVARYNIQVTASPFTFTVPRPTRVIISGGTVSAISTSRNGVTFDPTGITSGSVVLWAGEQIQVTYSVAPTMVGSELQ